MSTVNKVQDASDSPSEKFNYVGTSDPNACCVPCWWGTIIVVVAVAVYCLYHLK